MDNKLFQQLIAECGLSGYNVRYEQNHAVYDAAGLSPDIIPVSRDVHVAVWVSKGEVEVKGLFVSFNGVITYPRMRHILVELKIKLDKQLSGNM